MTGDRYNCDTIVLYYLSSGKWMGLLKDESGEDRDNEEEEVVKVLL
jgi:hypothetical protein